MPTWSQPGAPRRCPIGLGLRAAHVEAILASPTPVVDGFEILAENYDWSTAAGRATTLARLGRALPARGRTRCRLYVGSADGVDRAHLRAAPPRWPIAVDARMGHRPPVLGRGRRPHQPRPPAAALHAARWSRLCADAIRAVQDALGPAVRDRERQLVPAQWRESTMPEWDFVAEVAEAADCGILLDVNNVYVSGHQPRLGAADLPRAGCRRRASRSFTWPATRVHDGYLIDTHDQRGRRPGVGALRRRGRAASDAIADAPRVGRRRAAAGGRAGRGRARPGDRRSRPRRGGARCRLTTCARASASCSTR
jgi:hypothetical protein